MKIAFLIACCLSMTTLHAQTSGQVYHLVVAADGTGDCTTVQQAIDAVPVNNLDQFRIFIKAGTYHEHVFIPQGKSRVSLIGEGMDRVFITDDRKSGGPEAVPVDRGATMVVHANDVTIQGVSIVNEYGVRAQDGPQALALYAKGDRIAIDIPACKIELLVSDEELERRRAAWVCPEPKVKTGYLARYARLVSSADKGAILQI